MEAVDEGSKLKLPSLRMRIGDGRTLTFVRCLDE
jgi:hypothetical protein